MNPPPAWSTPHCVSYWIERKPEALAISEYGRDYAYRDLGAAIVRFVQVLAATAAGPGMLVGIECDNRFLHLALMLACRAVGATSVSLSAMDVETGDPILSRCGLLCVRHPPAGRAEGLLVLSQDTIDRIMGRPIHAADFAVLAREELAPAVPRLTKTSGTTGRPKVMPATAEMARAMLAADLNDPDDPGIAWNYLCVYNFTFRGAQRETELALRLGGTVVFTDAVAMLSEMDRFAGFRTSIMPGDVVRLVEAIPPEWRAPRTGFLAVKGGAMPAGIRATLESRVASHVEHHYATNETHVLALIGHDGLGRVTRHARIRIVDESGMELPAGETGLIEARTPYMATGYLWDEEANALGFRDGWYRTNDLGRLVAPGLLELLGRADDMVILGGLKLAPQSLESRIRDIPGIRDAVLIAIAGADGHDRLFAVVESDDPDIGESARDQVARILAPHIGGSVPIVRRRMPRTETGKVRRAALRDELARST